jgi:hypothetical protein
LKTYKTMITVSSKDRTRTLDESHVTTFFRGGYMLEGQAGKIVAGDCVLQGNGPDADAFWRAGGISRLVPIVRVTT